MLNSQLGNHHFYAGLLVYDCCVRAFNNRVTKILTCRITRLGEMKREGEDLNHVGTVGFEPTTSTMS